MNALPPFAQYLAEVSACLIVFYAGYRLVLEGGKHLRLTRAYLMLTLLASFALPLVTVVTFSLPQAVAEEPVPATVSRQDVQQAVFTSPSPGLTVQDAPAARRAVSPDFVVHAVLAVYLFIAFLLLVRYVVQVAGLLRLSIRSERYGRGRRNLILVPGGQGMPYSFLNRIYVNRDDYLEGRIPEEVLMHEEAHCRQGHSADRLLAGLATVVCWFHPAVYAYRRAIALNGEYLADEAALDRCDTESYGRTLVAAVFDRHAPALASHFHLSDTKKRLIMMTKLPSGRRQRLTRAVMLLPFTAAALLIASTGFARTQPATEKALLQPPAVTEEAAKEEAARKAAEAVEAARRLAREQMAEAEKQKEAAKVQLEAARKALEEQRKQLSRQGLPAGVDREAFELEMEQLRARLELELAGLEAELEKLEINPDDMDFDFDFEFDFEDVSDGVEKRIHIIRTVKGDSLPGMPGLPEIPGMESQVREIVVDGDRKIVILNDSGENHLEWESEDGKQVIIIRNGEKEIINAPSGGNEKVIIIRSSADGGEDVEIIERTSEDTPPVKKKKRRQ